MNKRRVKLLNIGLILVHSTSKQVAGLGGSFSTYLHGSAVLQAAHGHLHVGSFNWTTSVAVMLIVKLVYY